MIQKLSGKVWKFGDNIETDMIIPFRIKSKTLDQKELAMHCMEAIDLAFPKKVTPGDVIVAGKNFGKGSSREAAPLAIKACGIQAVIAESFARIFYRNALNVGLPVIECREIHGVVREGDVLEIDIDKGLIFHVTAGTVFRWAPYPDFLRRLLEAGGLVNYYNLHKRFPWLSANSHNLDDLDRLSD